MENKYQIPTRERLLRMSQVIEDAAYEVQSTSREGLIYAMGNSSCGSKCGSSRSSRGAARRIGLVTKVE